MKSLNSSEPEETPYDRAAELLHCAMDEMHAQGIPNTEVPPVLADFCIWAALRLGNTGGGEAILERMRLEVTQWSMGKHVMQQMMREKGESVPRPERMSPKPEFDASPLRTAMEHFLSYQRMPLDQSAACFVIYSLGLVYERLGPKRAMALVNTAKHELERLEREWDQDPRNETFYEEK